MRQGEYVLAAYGPQRCGKDNLDDSQFPLKSQMESARWPSFWVLRLRSMHEYKVRRFTLSASLGMESEEKYETEDLRGKRKGDDDE